MSWFLIEIAQDDWIVTLTSISTRKAPCIGPFHSRVAASWYHRYGRHLSLPVSADQVEVMAGQDDRMEEERVMDSLTPEEQRDALEFEAFDSIFEERRLFQEED